MWLSIWVLIGLVSLANSQILPDKPGIRVVNLGGSPYNRGLTHGRTLKNEIHDLIGAWGSDIEVRYKMPLDRFVEQFLKRTSFNTSISRLAPDLLEEVRGISVGSGMDFDTVLVFQLADEVWANGETVAADHCSSLGVNKSGKGPAYVAQTMDIPWLYRERVTVLHIRHEGSGLESFVLTAPGMLALNGMNNAGIGIACDTLSQLRSSTDGLPVAFVVRKVLEKQTLDEALKFVESIHHASGQNYIIGDQNRAVSIECSAAKTARFVPFPGSEITFHTNHPLVNDDYAPWYSTLLARSKRSPEIGTSSGYRFDSLAKRLSGRSVDLDLIRETLASRDQENGSISNELTFAATIMILSAKPEFHVAPGRPDLTKYAPFTFSFSSGTAGVH